LYKDHRTKKTQTKESHPSNGQHVLHFCSRSQYIPAQRYIMILHPSPFHPSFLPFFTSAVPPVHRSFLVVFSFRFRLLSSHHDAHVYLRTPVRVLCRHSRAQPINLFSSDIARSGVIWYSMLQYYNITLIEKTKGSCVTSS
jgi:hypothetical protein